MSERGKITFAHMGQTCFTYIPNIAAPALRRRRWQYSQRITSPESVNHHVPHVLRRQVHDEAFDHLLATFLEGAVKLLKAGQLMCSHSSLLINLFHRLTLLLCYIVDIVDKDTQELCMHEHRPVVHMRPPCW